jgi:curved DNA-binding protein CbpA
MAIAGETPFRFSSSRFRDYRETLISDAEWRELVKVAHPDKGGNAEAFAVVQKLKPKRPNTAP